jgi:hypothetical protein
VKLVITAFCDPQQDGGDVVGLRAAGLEQLRPREQPRQERLRGPSRLYLDRE